MGKPKKQTSPRKTGLRRSHLIVNLARRVNSRSPIKAYTTKRESGKRANQDAKVNKLPKEGSKKTAEPAK